jgi:hypothetical protein
LELTVAKKTDTQVQKQRQGEETYKTITERGKQWLVIRRETDTKTVFSVYEQTFDTDSSRTRRVFKGVTGAWRLYIMSQSESGLTDTVVWALDERDKETNFRRAIVHATDPKEGFQKALELLRSKRDESISWAMNKFFDKGALVIKRLIVQAFPEAEQGRLVNHLHIVIDKRTPAPSIELVKSTKSTAAAD